MGRAILIVVLLVSTIYAGISVQVQKEMYKLPGVMVNNFLEKGSESVSDYALRAAVRMAFDGLTLPADGETTVVFDSPYYIQGNATMGKYSIEKIHYKVTGDTAFVATTTIKGEMRGYSKRLTNGILVEVDSINYEAQIGFNRPWSAVSGPLVSYGWGESQVQVGEELPSFSILPEMIGGLYGYPVGSNQLDQIVEFLNYGVSGIHGSTNKSIHFGKVKLNGSTTGYVWIQVPSPSLMTTNPTLYQTLIDTLTTTTEFTAAMWVKPRNTSSGTLYWAASNPNNSLQSPLQPGYTRPSAAIWYDTVVGGSTATMHFGVTVADTTAYGTYYEITKTGCPVYASPKSQTGTWYLYVLVFKNGILTAYAVPETAVPGSSHFNPISTLDTGTPQLKPNIHGFTVGMRDIRGDTPTPLCPTQIIKSGTNYMPYNGVMDMITFWDQALNAAQISDYFWDVSSRSISNFIKD